MRDRPGAFKALKNALLLDPTRADTYLNLGTLLIETGQFEDAVECFERGCRLQWLHAGQFADIGHALRVNLHPALLP